jgi:hypothetical protein
MPAMLIAPDDVEQWLRGSSVEDALKMQARRCDRDPGPTKRNRLSGVLATHTGAGAVVRTNTRLLSPVGVDRRLCGLRGRPARAARWISIESAFSGCR